MNLRLKCTIVSPESLHQPRAAFPREKTPFGALLLLILTYSCRFEQRQRLWLRL
jgi:hypothetical protein